jgi:hypothetical protein
MSKVKWEQGGPSEHRHESVLQATLQLSSGWLASNLETISQSLSTPFAIRHERKRSWSARA